MGAGSALNIWSLATELLNVIGTHWTTAPGAPLPARQYVGAGEPAAQAWDCEQLVVSLGGIGWGQAQDSAPITPRGGTPASVMSMRHAVLDVSLVRCVPVSDRDGRPPAVDAMNAAGQQYLRDAGLLSQAMVQWASRIERDLAGPEDPRSKVQVGVIEPGPASGAFVSLSTTVIVTAATLDIPAET